MVKADDLYCMFLFDAQASLTFDDFFITSLSNFYAKPQHEHPQDDHRRVLVWRSLDLVLLCALNHKL